MRTKEGYCYSKEESTNSNFVLGHSYPFIKLSDAKDTPNKTFISICKEKGNVTHSQCDDTTIRVEPKADQLSLLKGEEKC